MPGERRPSDSYVDLFVIALAVWTLLCHLFVFAQIPFGWIRWATLPALLVAIALYRAIFRASERPVLDLEPDRAFRALQWLHQRCRTRYVVCGALLLLLVVLRLPLPFAVWVSLLGAGSLHVFYRYREDPEGDRAVDAKRGERLLWGLGVACAALTWIAIRPDLDDCVYLSLAVSAADHPELPALQFDGMHGIPGLPLQMPAYKVHSIELLAALARSTVGLDAIAFMHFVLPPLGALLCVFAYARLFRLLVGERWLVTTFTAVLLLVLMGGAHHWFGNFAFVRMHQGKAVFLSGFVPLLVSYSIQFMCTPSWRRWLLLALAQTAAIGLTATAVFVAPLTLAVTALSLGNIGAGWRGLQRTCVALLSSSYVAVLALLVAAETRHMMQGEPATMSGGKLWWSAVNGGTLGQGLLTLLSVAALVLAWRFATTRVGRRFLALGPLIFLTLILNPFVAQPVAEHVTSSWAYWRLLWVLPVPAFLSILLVGALWHAGDSRPVAVRVAGLGCVLGLLAALTPGGTTLSPSNGTELGLPRIKAEPTGYRHAKILRELTPPRSYVLAPKRVSVWLPTFHQPVFPLYTRPNYMATLRWHLGDDEVRRRRLLTEWVSPGGSSYSGEIFQRALDYYEIRAVAVDRSALSYPEIQRDLTAAGFVERRYDEPLAFWVRATEPHGAGETRAVAR